jgi:hypothetical protein
LSADFVGIRNLYVENFNRKTVHDLIAQAIQEFYSFEIKNPNHVYCYPSNAHPMDIPLAPGEFLKDVGMEIPYFLLEDKSFFQVYKTPLQVGAIASSSITTLLLTSALIML